MEFNDFMLKFERPEWEVRVKDELQVKVNKTMKLD